MIYYIERLFPTRYDDKERAVEEAHERFSAGRDGWTVEVASVDGAWEVSYVRSL